MRLTHEGSDSSAAGKPSFFITMTCNPYWSGRSAGRRRRVVNPDRATQLARDARAPAHKLKLKKGMVVMLLRNLNPIEGL